MNIPDSWPPQNLLSASLGRYWKGGSIGIKKTTGTEQKGVLKILKPTRIHPKEAVYAPAPGLAQSCDGSVLFGDDSNYGAGARSSAETDRARSRGMVSMAIASASE